MVLRKDLTTYIQYNREAVITIKMAESSQIEHREQQPDTTSTIEATTKTGPGRYKIPRRELAKREIRRLVLQEGLSGPQISARLSIPTRTVTRYLQEIY